MRKWFAAVLEDLYASVWAVRRTMKPGVRYPTRKERRNIDTMRREGIRRELENHSAAPLEHEERQQLAYWRLWRSIQPAAGEGIPPKILDPSVSEHVTLALSVVGDYDAAREDPGAFADCLYRPVSDLPYPQAAIRRCCEFLISIADADPVAGADPDAGIDPVADPDPDSLEVTHELLANEREALGLALFSLDYFLDSPANEIPRRKLDNLAYVRHKYPAGLTPLAKPRPGDMVIRSGSGMTEYVNQIIGVCDNDEWMVLTNSGASMQVKRSAELGKWDELKVIAPAAAAWLTLTPSAGMPSWGL